MQQGKLRHTTVTRIQLLPMDRSGFTNRVSAAEGLVTEAEWFNPGPSTRSPGRKALAHPAGHMCMQPRYNTHDVGFI